MLEPHTSLHMCTGSVCLAKRGPPPGGWITAADHSAVLICQHAGDYESGAHGSPAGLHLWKHWLQCLLYLQSKVDMRGVFCCVLAQTCINS